MPDRLLIVEPLYATCATNCCGRLEGALLCSGLPVISVRFNLYVVVLFLLYCLPHFLRGHDICFVACCFSIRFFFSLSSFDYSRVHHESALVGRPIKLSEHGPRPGPAHQFSKGRGLAISHFQNSTARSMTLVESQDRSKGRPMCCPLPQGARISAGVLFLY